MQSDQIYYDKEAIEKLKESFQLSPSTLHKMLNPMCGQCLAEKGKALVEGRIPWGS